MRAYSILFSLLLPCFVQAQLSRADSLWVALHNATEDRDRFNACVDLYFYYQETDRDSALWYADKRLELARKNNIALGEASALLSKAYQSNAMGRYADAFRYLTEALTIAEGPTSKEVPGWTIGQYPVPGNNQQIIIGTIHHVLGAVMRNTGNYAQEIVHLKRGVEIGTQINHPDRLMTGNMNLGTAYLRMGKLDSALYYIKAAEALSDHPWAKRYRGNNLLSMGDIFLANGQMEEARRKYYEGLLTATSQNNLADVTNLNHRLVGLYLREGNKDSAMAYARANLPIIQSVGGVGYREFNIGVAYEDLSLAFFLHNRLDSAYAYQRLALINKDSLNKRQIRDIADFQKLSLNEAMKLEKLEKEKMQVQSKIRTYGFLAGIGVLALVGFILFRSNRQKQKANAVLEKTLTELKSTQAQLIQQEKLASLGQLTAGIAHEIQNPLNFVNNFSEINAELSEEILDAAAKGDIEEVKALATDIKSNQEKIREHGKRADSIVKGMLQHSRSSAGSKEPTDLAALADEYLRLAYHGMRAKDKSFNASLKTEFDPQLPLVPVVSQDISRVLLNLFNNAFYAVHERKKSEGEGYEPEVRVGIRKDNTRPDPSILITVSDNGPGIPESIREKIFQPFFTTKPTGQGTGLGLSLSYDIVKTHGGEIKVHTRENQGTEFTIQLPLC